MTHQTTHDSQHIQTRGDAAARPGDPQLDCSLSVNAIMAVYPSTVSVFNRFGIDTCCGAALSVVEAATAGNVDLETLCGALTEAIPG